MAEIVIWQADTWRHTKPGNLVWLFNPEVPRRRSRKNFRSYTDPFQVLLVSDTNYTLQNTRTWKITGVHFDRLKSCLPDVRSHKGVIILSLS